MWLVYKGNLFVAKAKKKKVAKKIVKKRKEEKKSEGAPGFEPGTSRSAVECSTTELYPQPWQSSVILQPRSCGYDN